MEKKKELFTVFLLRGIATENEEFNFYAFSKNPELNMKTSVVVINQEVSNHRPSMQSTINKIHVVRYGDNYSDKYITVRDHKL